MELDKGYLIVAVTEEEQFSSELLAMSIKLKNSDANITLSVPNIKKMNINNEDVFDQIIELPFNRRVSLDESIWQAYWITPYQQTIVVHPYSIVCENLDGTWDYLEKCHDICFANSSYDFRGNKIQDYEGSFYVDENIQHAYTSMFYFKKSDISLQYFTLLDTYLQYWKVVCDKMVQPEHLPDYLDVDMMFSLALKILDIDNAFPINDEILATINTDSITYNLKEEEKVENIFSEYLNVWVRKDSNIKIHNFIVNGTLFYNSPLFLTEEIYDNYKTKYQHRRFRESVVD